MSKKIIAALLVATMLFVVVFAACNNEKEKEEAENTKVYVDETEYNFVTDADGNRVYTSDGEFVVYVTEENGKVVTNAAGESQTMVQQFVPLIEDNKAEYYGYTIELPEGWEPVEGSSGSFINKKQTQQVSIRALEKTYDEYYEVNKTTYETLAKEPSVTATWEEDIQLAEGCSDVVRFTMKTEEGMSVMYFFVNNGNLYKILFDSLDIETAVPDSEAICKAISYKPYQYFEIDVTAHVTEETSSVN